jgi:hypothetical protein
MLTVEAPELSWPQQVLALAERMRPGTVLDPRCTVHRAYRFDAEPDLDLLGRVLSTIVAQQDALRTVPIAGADGVRPACRAPAPVEVEVLPGEAGSQQRDAIAATARAPHDLDAGPLLRANW